MPSSRLLALDCGASRTTAGVFTRLAGGRLRLDEFALEPLPAEAGRDDQWVERTRQALLALRPRLKSAPAVLLGVPGHVTLTKFVRAPRVEPAKRQKIIRFEAQQNIPYALSEVVWDSRLVADDGLDMEIMFCAAKLDIVESLCGAAEQAGFLPRALQPVALATLAAFRHAHPAATAAPVLIANIGARSTTLVFAEKQRFFARTIAQAGGNVTQALADEAGLDYAQAESFKLAARPREAAAVADAALQRAVEACATRLAQEITRSTINYRRHAGSEPPARLLLTGAGSLPAGLPALLSEKLKLPVARFDPLAGIEISPRAAASDVAAHAAALTDLVGLAAAHLAAEPLELNLLPPRLRRFEQFRRRQPWVVAAAALAAAALVPPILYFHSTADAAQRKTDAIEAQLAPLRALDARNRANLDKLEEAKREIGLLQGVYESRASWLQLFADLQERLVRIEDVWLEKLQIQHDTVEAAAPAPGGEGVQKAPLKISLSGRLLDKANPLSKVSIDSYQRVKTLLAKLSESRFVATVENERFDNTQPGILRFDFTLVVNPQKPL